MINLLGEEDLNVEVSAEVKVGFVYVPYLLADGIQFFTAFANSNPGGIDRVQSLGENTFGFEDQVGGGDADFNDYVISFETV